jgi:hypothetical protein
MVKKTTLNELGEMLSHVVKHMETLATKDDLKKIDNKIDNLQIKVNGIEGQLRNMNHVKLVDRVCDLEEKVFGAARA